MKASGVRMLAGLCCAGLCFATAVAALLPGTCAAWGREGHQIVALLAERELTPQTRANVAALLAQDGRKDLLAASTWADETLGQRPETAPWHYVDIPISAPSYAASRDCPQGACVVAQLERLRGVLASPAGSPAASPAERAEALKFLVHLVADVHQPLHAACATLPQLGLPPPRKRPGRPPPPLAFCGGQPHGDRGGNDIKVRFGDEGINLHQVWDTELLYELRGSAQEIAARLDAELTDAQRRDWPLGSPEDWANESHRLAQSVAYGLLPKDKRIVIPPRYEIEARRTIERQLQRAGLRLARVLEEAVGP